MISLGLNKSSSCLKAYSNVSHKPVKSDHYIDDGLDNQFPTNVINSRPKIPPFGKGGPGGTPFENPPIPLFQRGTFKVIPLVHDIEFLSTSKEGSTSFR